MSKINLYTMKDAKTGSYDRVMHSINHQTMRRSCALILEEPDDIRSIYPEDYSIFHIGMFDTETGKLEYKDPDHLFNLGDLRKVQEA